VRNFATETETGFLPAKRRDADTSGEEIGGDDLHRYLSWTAALKTDSYI
jgi:hypothetical protein